jgi:hypothetical protein
MGNAKRRGRSGAGAERAKSVASAIQKTRRGEGLTCIQVEIEGVCNRGDEGGVDRGKILLVRPICSTNGRISALIRIYPPLQNGSRGD